MKKVSFAVFLGLLLLALIMACNCEKKPASPEKDVIGSPKLAPIITITSQPGECPYGNWASGPISGYVNNVDISQCFVALYAETDNFYVQPLISDKKTIIQSDGTFSNDTHCGHHYIAILAKNSWDPPNTMVMLPPIGGDILAIDREPEVRIDFAGETWIVKSSQAGKLDPGPNYWLDQTSNVWVDGLGELHLKITYSDSKWSCAEIYSDKSFGYGEYTWYADSRVDQLDRNVVLGLFAYEYINKEIDIEFSKWGDPDYNNSQYVIQPWNTAGNLHSFNTALTGNLSTHRFIWTASEVEFISWQGHASTMPSPDQIIQYWHYTGADNPAPGQEKARMNLWLNNGQPPTDGKEVEVVISNFTWKPVTGPLLGNLSVSSTPSGSTIWLDGVNTGFVTPYTFTNLIAGNHQLKLVKSGYKEWNQEVIITSGETTQVNATLSLASTSIIINSTPSDAEIWINGQNTGETTPDTLSDITPGPYAVRLLLAKYFPYETSCTLSLGQTQEINAIMDFAPSFTIVYTTGDTAWAVKLDGFNPVKYAIDFLDIGPYSYGDLLWSPDGNYLTYTANTGMTILNRDGTNKASFPFSSTKRVNDFSWSHSNQFQINGSYVDGIYSYNVNSGELKRILQTGGYTYDHNPVFSFGDSLIAYLHHEYGGNAWVRLMRSNGTNPKTVSKMISTGYDENLNLAWISAYKILFKVGSKGIYLLDLKNFSDTTISPTQVISASVSQLQVSPNLLYYAYITTAGDLYYGSLGNWTPALLTKLGSTSYPRMAWSPDDMAIVCRVNNGIYWVYLDGKCYHIIRSSLGVGGISVTSGATSVP